MALPARLLPRVLSFPRTSIVYLPRRGKQERCYRQLQVYISVRTLCSHSQQDQ